MRDGVSFFRIGSDPEYLFEAQNAARPGTWVLARADRVLACTREEGMGAAIGTDGHATTGELRPRPSHNVHLHLHDVALMINQLATYIGEDRLRQEWGPLRLSAGPWVQNEPLGGHIHMSFFVGYKSAHSAYMSGVMYHQGTLQRRGTPFTRAKPNMEELEEYIGLANSNRIPTPDIFGRVMDYFNVPLDAAVHNPTLRAARLQRYGFAGDLVRADLATDRHYTNIIPKRGAYYHFEYRRPASWLRHPMLAYLHLALSKLTMLNFDRVAAALAEVEIDPMAIAQNVGREMLLQRIDQIGGWKRTKDLALIEPYLTEVDNRVPAWGLTPEVDVEAWRALL